MDGRVLVALADGPLVASPTWTRIDELQPNFCAGYDIRAGRQGPDEQTDTGSATVYFNDKWGYLDSANVSSPLYGLAGRQILLQLLDPVTGVWESQWRGIIDYQTTDFHDSQVLANVKLECVDVFDKLARTEMVPGQFGNTPRAGYEGTIFYEDTAGTVDDRIIQALGDAGVIYPDRAVVFSGNVKVGQTYYDPGDSVLEVLRDCVDSEIPMIGNHYVDRFGRYCFHGRESRFDPEAVAATTTTDRWTFTRWKAGDGAAIALDSTRAQIRVLSTDEGRRDVINAALVWPHEKTPGVLFPQEEIPDQIYTDLTSQGAYGYHALPPIQDLVVIEGSTTGNDSKTECQKYAELFVKNMKDPVKRVTALMLKSLHPDDPRAAATWAMATRADISDALDLKVSYPSGTGIDAEDYYIEGITKRVRPLNPDFDYVEAEFDISPAVWTMDTHGVFA